MLLEAEMGVWALPTCFYGLKGQHLSAQGLPPGGRQATPWVNGSPRPLALKGPDRMAAVHNVDHVPGQVFFYLALTGLAAGASLSQGVALG